MPYSSAPRFKNQELATSFGRSHLEWVPHLRGGRCQDRCGASALLNRIHDQILRVRNVSRWFKTFPTPRWWTQ